MKSTRGIMMSSEIFVNDAVALAKKILKLEKAGSEYKLAISKGIDKEDIVILYYEPENWKQWLREES